MAEQLKSSPVTKERIPIEEAGGFVCDAKIAQRHIGEAVTPELGQKIMQISSARQLRWVPPRTPVTKDFRPMRINIYYGDDKVITAINCG